MSTTVATIAGSAASTGGTITINKISKSVKWQVDSIVTRDKFKKNHRKKKARQTKIAKNYAKDMSRDKFYGVRQVPLTHYFKIKD